MRPALLTDKVYTSLKYTMEALKAERAPLPSERQLGQTFGVSRTVIRKALKRLKDEHVVSRQFGNSNSPFFPTGKSKGNLRIGLVLPVLNSYTSEMVHSVDSVISKEGHELTLILTNSDKKVEAERVRQGVSNLSGLIVMHSLFGNSHELEQMYHEIIMANIPVVFIDSQVFTLPCDAVVWDRLRNTYCITRELLNAEAQRIFTLISHQSIDLGDLEGIKRCLKDWQTAGNGEVNHQVLSFSPNGIITDEKSLSQIHACISIDDEVTRILEACEGNEPVGVICSDGFIAAALLDKFDRLQVPGELRPKVVSIGTPPVLSSSPELIACIGIKEHMWSSAGLMMLERIAGYSGPPRRVKIAGTVEMMHPENGHASARNTLRTAAPQMPQMIFSHSNLFSR